MYNFDYVTKNERKPIKRQLIEIFKLVQNEVRDKFTFRFDFIGSEPLNMVTCDLDSNIGFDFDVNVQVNDRDENYEAFEIKNILMKAFNKVLKEYDYSYDNCEDSTRVFTIKVKDYETSRIIHSCDIAIVFYCGDGRQQYIRFNKKQDSYYWEYQPEGYYNLDDKIKWLKHNRLWQEVRDTYLIKKNYNNDSNKKSRAFRAETINEIYNANKQN